MRRRRRRKSRRPNLWMYYLHGERKGSEQGYLLILSFAASKYPLASPPPKKKNFVLLLQSVPNLSFLCCWWWWWWWWWLAGWWFQLLGDALKFQKKPDMVIHKHTSRVCVLNIFFRPKKKGCFKAQEQVFIGVLQSMSCPSARPDSRQAKSEAVFDLVKTRLPNQHS